MIGFSPTRARTTGRFSSAASLRQQKAASTTPSTATSRSTTTAATIEPDPTSAATRETARPSGPYGEGTSPQRGSPAAASGVEPSEEIPSR